VPVLAALMAVLVWSHRNRAVLGAVADDGPA
jgi:hypothetical protein